MKQITTALLWIALIVLGTGAGYGQTRNQYWYFGRNAGLRFNGTSPALPTVLTDGQVRSSEASTAVTDAAGNLHFYTDAVRIWDRTHALMHSGLLTGGHQSTTQGALVLPDPANDQRYYVFNLDAAERRLAAGLHYSIVDMTLRNGLGALTAAQNVAVTTPAAGGRLTEKLTAVLHANGRDYWVLVHGWQNNEFYAYLLSPAGLSAAPVISTLGLVHTGDTTTAINGTGYLRASPDGRLVAAAVLESGIELFDFDNSTGRLSNERRLHTTDGTTDSRRYGLAFSPDNTKLYATGGKVLSQFDLTTNPVTQQQIVGPLLGTTINGLNALATGPDGRIYLAVFNAPALAAITNPNAAGAACGFVTAFLPVSGTLVLGLPNFPNAYPVKPALAFTAPAACAPATVDFRATASGFPAGAVFRWSFGDAASGSANTATGLTAAHAYAAPGRYVVRLQGVAAGDTTSVTQQLTVGAAPDFRLGPADTLVCLGSPLVLGPVPPAPAGSTFRWQDGSTSPTHAVTAPGVYAVEVTRDGCSRRAEIRVNSPCQLPNIITPNQDECNDYFVLQGLHAPDWALDVYNRWGRRIYQATSYQNNWGAAGQPAGTYYYHLRHARTAQTIRGYVEVMR